MLSVQDQTYLTLCEYFIQEYIKLSIDLLLSLLSQVRFDDPWSYIEQGEFED